MQLADLAVGDLLGSCLMNLLILAVLDLSHHARGKMFSRQGAAHALSGSVSAGLAALVALGILTAKPFEPHAVLGIAPAIMILTIAYLLGVRLVYLDQRVSIRTALDVPGATLPGVPPISLARAIFSFAACAVAILLAGPYLAAAAGELAERTALGNSFVGTTLVAFCTSLPELVSMLAAVKMGAIDLAIGNAFGSNAFNMLLLLPLNIVHGPSLLADISPRHAITCIAAVLATQVAIMGQLYQSESRIRIIEPDAWLVILTVVGALALVYYLP
jgi:cation:H+ antiporter